MNTLAMSINEKYQMISKFRLHQILLTLAIGSSLGMSLGAFAQYNPAPSSGYSNDGTLYMGGQKIGNPHQILHDAQIPSFMTITANRYTYTNNPNHGQGTLTQMEAATIAGSGGDMLLNRLYLSPTNPYSATATGPYPNYQTYQGVLANAQAAGYRLVVADDGKTYAVKTLTAASTQAQTILMAELPNTAQFRAAADPLGGGVGVRVTQNGDAAALAAYMATVKPYDFSWQPGFGNWGQLNSNNAQKFDSEGAPYSTTGHAIPLVFGAQNEFAWEFFSNAGNSAHASALSSNFVGFNNFNAGSSNPCSIYGFNSTACLGSATGKLLPEDHRRAAIEAALRYGYSPEQAKKFGQDVVDVDNGTQTTSPEHSVMHNMRGIDPATGMPITQEQFWELRGQYILTASIEQLAHLTTGDEVSHHLGENNSGVPWYGTNNLLAMAIHGVQDLISGITGNEDRVLITLALLQERRERDLLDKQYEQDFRDPFTDIESIVMSELSNGTLQINNNTDYSGNPLGLSTGDDGENSSGGVGGCW